MASLTFVVGSLLLGAVVPSSWDLDDGFWLLIPVGGSAGIYLAVRLRHVVAVHIACLLLGGIGALLLFWSAYEAFTTPAALRPGWDGLQDRLTGIVLTYFGITAACIAVGGLAGLIPALQSRKGRAPESAQVRQYAE